MRDGPQAAQQVIELVVRQGQRVAAGDQHVPDLGLGLDVGQCPLPLRFGKGIVAAGLAHHARTRAVAAVGRTKAGRQEQHAVGVAVDQPRHLSVVILTQRVVGFAGRANVFLPDGDVCAAQPVVGIVAIEQARVIRRDAHG
jgi:hypothetical protein